MKTKSEEYLEELSEAQIQDITLMVLNACLKDGYGFEYSPDVFCGCIDWLIIPKSGNQQRIYISFHDFAGQSDDEHNESYKIFCGYVQNELNKMIHV